MLSFELIVILIIILVLCLISKKSLNSSNIEQFIRWQSCCRKQRNPFTGRNTCIGCFRH